MRLSRGFLMIVALALLAGPALRADEPLLLRYKFNKGDKLLFRSSVDLKQVQSFLDQKLQTGMTSESLGSRSVDSVDEQGVAHIKARTERIKVKTKIVGLDDYEFDSKSTERDRGSEAGGALTPIFDRLNGSEFDLYLSSRGEVKEVKGYGEMLADVVKDNMLGVQLTKGASNGSAQLSIQESLPILSDKPVKPGDEWESPVEIDLPRIGKIKGTFKCNYVGPDKVGDVATAKISITPLTALEVNVELGGIKVTGTLSTSSSEGVAQFDPAAGKLVSLKTTQTISGQLLLDGAIPFQSEQTQVTTFELLDKLPD